MNTLLRDRNTLKRLVESYGKQDVLNFVRHLDESINNLSAEEKNALMNALEFYVFENGWASFAAADDEFGEISYVELDNNELIIHLDALGYDLAEYEDIEANPDDYDCILKICKSSTKDAAIIKNILSNVNSIKIILDYSYSDYAKINAYYAKEYANVPDQALEMPCKFLDISDNIDDETGQCEYYPSVDIELQEFAGNKFGSF